jgi:hypothetical protein
MHFRFRGNNVQIVKSQPDPATGKAKSVPVGSINRSNMAISDKLRSSCSPVEIKRIEDWVARYQVVDRLKTNHAALTLPEQIASATEWFETANPAEARELADDILTAMRMLRSVLQRREIV